MKVFGLKTATWYALAGLFLILALLPMLKAAAPEYFPSSDGFRDLDCQGVTCPEGQFCGQGKRCVEILPKFGGQVPEGNIV